VGAPGACGAASPSGCSRLTLLPASAGTVGAVEPGLAAVVERHADTAFELAFAISETPFEAAPANADFPPSSRVACKPLQAVVLKLS
jgi:hypothetical protein